MIALLLMLAVPCPHPARSHAATAAFRRMHPCPGGPDKGSKLRCRGWVIDHIVSLACCGPDAPCNMRYMTVEAAKEKDRWENKCSSARKRVRNSCGAQQKGAPRKLTR